jgi:tetratricopeptide (TPR) repeat protein
MALGRVPERPVPARVRAAWLDWVDEQRDDPTKYAELAGPSLVTVLDAVQKAVIAALSEDDRAAARAVHAFGGYRHGAARMPQYAARFADVISQGKHAASALTAEDVAVLLRSAVSAGLMATGHPAGALGLTPDQVTAAGQAGGHLSAAAARAVTGRRPGEIPVQEYDLATDPARELTRRVAAAVRTAAGHAPLVIFLDTGEVIGDRAWGWLRRVMRDTGPDVAWVVGARFESEAEAGADSPVAQFVRDIGDQHLIMMSPGRFDDEMIRAYLNGRAGVPGCTDEQIDMIARFTRGLPLAVSFTATLLEEGQPVAEACREVDDGHPSSVVSRLARRYLIHAEKQVYDAGDPRRGDLEKILGLALAYADLRGDPDLLAAMWDTQDPLGDFHDLGRRHDFVLPVSRRLHEDVLVTLRSDLLDPYRRARVREISQRALDLLAARLEQIRRRCPDLDTQLADDGFASTMLSALWHTFWLSNRAGLDLVLTILPLLAAADPPTAAAAVTVTDQFAGTFDPGELAELNLLTRSWRFLTGSRGRRRPSRPVRELKITARGLDLASRQAPAGAGLIGTADDRRAAISILRAQLLTDEHDDSQAITSLRAAAALSPSQALRTAIGDQAHAIASRLIWAGQGGTAVSSATGLAAAELATGLTADNARAWHTYAVALDTAGRREDALAAYDQALTVEPAAAVYHNRGNLLRVMGRAEDAMADFGEALALHPRYASVHHSRGVTLHNLGRFEEAVAAYDQALDIDPRYAIAHRDRGVAFHSLKRYEDALTAYDQAVAIDREYAIAHCDRGVALHDLGRFEEALAAYDQAIVIDPGYADAHRDRGDALRHLGRIEEALAAQDRALELNPGDVRAINSRGTTLAAAGRLDEALAAHEQALTLDPRRAPAHNSRGDVLRALGRLDEALAEHDKAIAIDPRSAQAHTGRGFTLHFMDRLGDALAAHDQALGLNPHWAMAHAGRGLALHSLSRDSEALAAHERALELDPRSALAHTGRGMVLDEMRRPGEALAAHDQAIALDPASALAHTMRGWTLADLGQSEAALAAFDQALALAPDNPITTAVRAAALRKMSESSEQAPRRPD